MYQFISTSVNGDRVHASRELERECMTVMKKYHRVMKMIPGVNTSEIISNDQMTGFISTTVKGLVTVFKLVRIAEGIAS